MVNDRLRWIGIALGAAVAVSLVSPLARLLNEDRCYDAGGAVMEGMCHFAGRVQSIGAWPGSPGEWVLVVVLSTIPGWIVHRLVCWKGKHLSGGGPE